MSYESFTLIVAGGNLFGGPALALYCAARLRRRTSSRTDWSGYTLGFCVLSGIMALSPAGWGRIAPDGPADFGSPLAGAELVFGVWAAAFLTGVIGVVSGVIGFARANQQERASVRALVEPHRD